MPERAAEQLSASRKGAAKNTAKADQHAGNVLPIILQIEAGGSSLRQIAAVLNERGIKTARDGLWYAATVRNILARQQAAKAMAA